MDLSDISAYSAASKNVFSARRAFISELQAWIRPRNFSLEGPTDKAGIDLKVDYSAKNWQSVEAIVDEFESRYGPRSFWNERPITHVQLLAELKSAKSAAST